LAPSQKKINNQALESTKNRYVGISSFGFGYKGYKPKNLGQKGYGIKVRRRYWEHIGNLRNMLGTH
jgi:hypothetical protein